MEWNNTDEFTTEEVMDMIDATVEAQLAGGDATILYMESPPGIGKTKMICAYAEWKEKHGSKALGIAHPKVLVRINILSQSDSVDFGAPAPDFKEGKLNFLVPDDILGQAKGDEQYDIVMVFWDELPNANPATLSAWQSVAEEGEIRGRKKADNCVYIAAGNRPEDKCGARALPRSIREGRIITVPMGVSMPRLIAYAEEKCWDARLVAMLGWAELQNKEMLNSFDPNTKSKVQPSPRGVQKLNSLLNQGLDEKILDALAPGCVGDKMWTEIRAFFIMAEDLPTLTEIFDDPDGARMPGEDNPEVGPNGQYAVISNVAAFLQHCKNGGNHVESKTFNAIASYFERMDAEMLLFGLKLCQNAHDEFSNCSKWGELQVTHSEITLG